MIYHPRAALTLNGRRELVFAIERGMTLKRAAARFNVSPATAHKWWHRWRAASPAQRASGACLVDRSSRPRRSPALLCQSKQRQICAVRRRTGWGPRLVAGEVGAAHATVWRALKRAGLSRRPRAPPEAVRRYQWPCPGDLLHIDTKRFQRFIRPGHAVTGVRDQTGADKRLRLGHEFVHSIVDDHSRLAYSERHPDERAATVTGFVERALEFFADHGVKPERLMSDNAWSYTHNRALRELLARGRTPRRARAGAGSRCRAAPGLPCPR
ncbi:MAG: DDE-type integrase/transposase/recombinase [Thermoleophilaceae bacterium]|nr:DDE-type integrase/transposase/recombinase [Thermoleophilaceae bacterium]